MIEPTRKDFERALVGAPLLPTGGVGPIAPAFECHDSIGSTQTRIIELSGGLSFLPALVVAAEQTAGRGRFGHTWASPRGGLWFSLLFDDPRIMSWDDTLPVSIVAALAARAALARIADVDVRLKWPNDLFVSRRKIGGVIASAHGPAIALGVGLNVNLRRGALPLEVAEIATSTLEETGREIALPALLRAFLDELHARFVDWATGWQTLHAEAETALIREHAVRWRPPPPLAPRKGRVVCLARNGALVAEDERDRFEITTGDLDILWPT